MATKKLKQQSPELLEILSRPDARDILYPARELRVSHAPLPTSLAWHEHTQWRHAAQLKRDYPSTYAAFRAQNRIPLHILKANGDLS